ncbi:hypothetical protein [Psychrobacillus sp. FSL K6-1415]|uniref:hypothetical protein n=1 Tax=Psychrobacillus sp. FSL K6-1415 TaxID=2921544 RepID=UPI0030FBA2B7
MARKSTKQARFDALTQRQQRKQLKKKQYTKKEDGGNRWGDKMLTRLHALKAEDETDVSTSEEELKGIDTNE